MIVDTSALAAILLDEPDAPEFGRALARARTRLISAVTRVEIAMVIESRKRDRGRSDLESLLRTIPIETVAVTDQHAEIAIEAFRRYGKGRHRAALNIGDCFAYALAKATDLPLLYKGSDFSRTDIRPALVA